MTDFLDRLRALADRYAIQEELGAGGTAWFSKEGLPRIDCLSADLFVAQPGARIEHDVIRAPKIIRGSPSD